MKRNRVVLALLLVVCVGLLGMWAGYRLAASFHKPAPQVIVGPALLKEIQRLNEWLSVRNVVQTVVAVRQARPPLGDEKLVLIVCGRVEAGVRLDELTTGDVTVDATRNSIEITLPPPVILRTYIDDSKTQVWERTKPLFVKYDASLEQVARQDALAAIEKTAHEIGILAQARKFAEANVRGLLQTLGFQQITIRFRDGSKEGAGADPKQ